MEDIEYLDEYKDLVLPGIKSGAPPASSAGVPRQRRISSDSSNSSSIDADIFQKLFHGKYLDDELLNEGSGSKSQDRRRRSPTSSSSDESNDALEALFRGKSSQSKPTKRRERYESFDSVDDLGEALMRPSHKLSVLKPSTSQASSKKSQDVAPHRSISNSSSSNVGKSLPATSSQTYASAKNKKINSVANKTTLSANGDRLASAKNKTVTIVKPQKTDLTSSRHEPKTDPLTLGDLYGDSDSDSSYEYESDFYGDRDSDEEDEPVIDISTDTSRTTSVADTVTPVVSDDEVQEPKSELNPRTENDQESFLSSTYERLQLYLSNLSCAEAPPIYKKQNSAKKSRSNEKKPSSSEQVKHANERSAASDKEANEKERDLEPPEASSSAKSSASKASGSRKLFDVDDNVTLEAVERMSLDLAEKILEIDVERSHEFEKRSASKTRSTSKSKIPADPSTSQLSHVRKLTYSSEKLDQSEPLGTQLRRSKSESFPKRGRPRGQKQRKNRAATTEEKTSTAPDGEGEPVKRKRGRPRKNIPKEDPTTVETSKNPIEGLDKNVPLSIEAIEERPGTDTVNLEQATKQNELISELDNAKELTGSTNLCKDDIKMTSSHHETDLKCAPDRVALDKSEPASKDEEEPLSKLDTSTETFDTAQDHHEASENGKNLSELEDKGLASDKEETQKESDTDILMETNDNAITELPRMENSVGVELPAVFAEAKAVSGNILEESDSQLAEDIKLAEEILAAEVGKGVESNEVSVESVQGGQDPVIEIVKELEQETISELVPAQTEKQSSVEDQSIADDENLLEEQTPDKTPSSSKDEPPAEEHSPVPDQDPLVKQETPDKEQNQAPKAESLPGSDVPSSLVSPSKKRNHSSPTNTPKKSKELEALQSSVPRRALRSDKVTPQNQRVSRSKRTLKTELTLLMDDAMRRSSPRLGRSPAESHSSQERSPVEKKVAVSKLAKDLTTTEREKVKELKSLPDESETKDVKETKTTTAANTSILTEEKPSSSKTEMKKLKGKPLKAKKSSRTHETEVNKAIVDSSEEPSSSSKCVEEYSTSSESEQKDDSSLCPKPGIDSTNPVLEQSNAIETDTEQVEEKRSSRRKSRRIRKEKGKTETDTLSDHLDAKKVETASITSKDQQSNPVTAKDEQHSSRLSRKDKSVIDAAKSEKDETPAFKSQSTERSLSLNKTPSEKDQPKEQSGNTIETVVGPLDKRDTSNSKKLIDEKYNESSESEMQSSDSSMKKESDSTKLLISSPDHIMQDHKNVLDAINEGGDSDPHLRETVEDSREADKKPEENDTKNEEEDSTEFNANTYETKSSSEKDAIPILIDSSQKSTQLRVSKAKSKNKRKKNEKKPNDSIAEPDIKDRLDVNTETIQATCSTSSESDKKDNAKSDETNEEPNSSETEVGRIRKRRQAVTIENSKDDFETTQINENQNQNRYALNSEEQVPLPVIFEPDMPTMKIPTKTYLMNTKNKTPSLASSEAPDNDPKPDDLNTTLKGDSKTISDVLTTEAIDLDNTNILETNSTQDLKEHVISDQTLSENSVIIPSSTKNPQIVFSTTPTKSNEQTKNTFITPKKSAKSKRNVSKEPSKPDNSSEDSQIAASESSTSKIQKELSSPTASCRKLRVLIKRTPTSNLPTSSRKSIFKKAPAKSKRLTKILESMEKSPPREQCDNKSPMSSGINPEGDPVAELEPVAVPDSDKDLATNEIPNDNTDTESKQKEDDPELEVNDVCAKGENPITDDSTEDVLSNKPTDSDVLQDSKDEVFNSLACATQDEDASAKELTEEKVSNDETAKDESEKEEISKDQEPDTTMVKEDSAPTAKAAEEMDLETKDNTNVKSVEAEPETDVTDDEELAQSPIPDLSETTSVTDDPEPSTSSVVKRSLRKRDADSSQPDEAAKRKQRPDMEKSLTGKKEPVKPARRRQLADEEERPSLKRSKMESESKSSVQGKFISIIGNETIMSSTTAPSLETKGETTSPATRKSAVQESKHVEIIKHVILGTPAKKLHHPDSPASEVKKPMVQTLLSSTLSLHKPSAAESSSPLKIRKSLKKLNADENVVGDQSIYSSSIAFPKKTSPVAPRKVNISVSLLQTKDTEVDTLTTAASKSEASLLTKKAQLETQKSTKKSEGNKKTESKKKSTVQGPQMKSLKSEETESSKKTVAAAVTGRKPLPQLEVSTKPESRKSEGSLSESNPRKDPSQVPRFSKMDSRKSEGTALSATARKRLTQPEVSKSEAASKAAESDNIVQASKIEAMSKGRGPQKKSKTDQRKSKPKTEVRSLEEEASTDPMDSSRSDISDNPGTFAESQGIFNIPGHMNRDVSSNRSLAPTPTPISDRQRNSSKERFTPVSDQKKAMRQSQTLVKPRGRGGRNQQLDLKRKAGDAEDGTEVINPKRPRELQEEDPPEQDVHVRESAFVAFPVKITAASAVNPIAVRSTANTIPQKAKLRKLCVKMNRRPFNNWLRSMQEKNETQEGSRNVTLLPPHGETSETDSAAESMSESMLQPQVESVAVTQPQPASQSDSYPAPTSELEKEESSAQLAPIAANEPPANNDSSTAPASNIAPENEQTVNPPAKTTLKTAIYPLTEKQLPDETALLESARKLAEQRRVQMFHAKSMPLPVPILEVKSEPEDVTDEHPPNEPLQAVATAPAILPPNSITEDAVPATIQISPLHASTSSRPPELHSIPSASAPDGNPNAIGQTKMFSFLYPKRYKRSYDDVGLDFCCPNLDGPMRAIDFTRLHSKAEVPVLEVPQFLVITTKFISKADKNMPSKVRAKLELLGRAKERDSTNLTRTGNTPTADATAPSSFPHAPASVGPATQPFPSIIHNLLSAPLPAPGSFNIPTCVDPSTSTPVVPTSSSPSCLDSLSKQLPRGTTLTKKSVQAVATIPSLASTSIAHNMAPSLIQLPPICPKDKQRVELQARVQVFDMVLQTLSRRAANLSLSERQRTIEEIVRTSSLMAIDVDVGTKLLENYVHYLNKATSTQSNSMATSVTASPSSLGASAGSTLSKSIVSSTTASSDIPPQGTNRSGEHVQMRSSLPATMPLYDGDHTSDFQFTPSKSTAGRMSASTSHAAAALGKVQPRSTQGMQKSFAGNTSQFVNLNTTVSMPAPRMNAKKPALCKKKTSPVRTLSNTTSLPTARAKTNASLSAVLGETPAAEFVSPAGMSLSTTGNPNVFIINHALQSEESILPDSNSSVGHLETEIKGELDDSTEVII
ncbi:titin isoform X2 [Drosophila teissieri]|uniref:titin isoform X2 n=1 Tax=Drosophila teissieri TaxID=7243 RepID=UPI001CB9FA9D|nr:titin isoform X2 [Drosophila teissieri]